MKFFISVCLVLLLLGLMPEFNACEETNLAIEITNNTSETLFVYVVYNPPLNGQKEIVGQVAPGSTTVKDLKKTYGVVDYITVKAENSGGHVAFSQEFSRDGFVDIGGKVTIPPLLLIDVTNNTSEALFVYMSYYPPHEREPEPLGNVAAGSTIQKYVVWPSTGIVDMSVVAKSNRGEVMYGKGFT